MRVVNGTKQTQLLTQAHTRQKLPIAVLQDKGTSQTGLEDFDLTCISWKMKKNRHNCKLQY